MKRYGRKEIERFLREVDAALDQPVTVVVIGYAAAIVAYGAPGKTQDVDTWTTVDPDLATAVERARQSTGLPLPFGKSGVADPPYEFESRLTRSLPHLKRLVVLVPERHDLALMKAVRGDRRDLDAIEELHHTSPLDCDVLVSRYRDEMGQAIGDPRRLRANFLALIERLFPDRIDEVVTTLDGRRRGSTV